MKGHEDSSYTRKVKIVSKILPNTMDSLSLPQARKNHFIYTWQGWDFDMEPLALEPPAGLGGSKNPLQEGGSKNGLQGG